MFDNPLPTLLALSLIALVAALVTVIRALAQRERAEEARHLAAALVDAEPAPRLLCGRDGRVLHANAAARALLGDAPPLVALAGRLIDDDTAHDGIARLRAAAEAGVPERVDLPLVPASGPAGPLAAGSPEWWQVSLRPVRVTGHRGNGNRGTGVLAGAMAWTLEDVTARRVIDDILIREREDLAEFLYLMPVGLYSADAEGRLRFVNQRLAEWLGVTPEDLAARTLDDVLDGGGAPTEAEGAWRGEVTFTARSGRTFPALILQNTYDDAGETRTRSVVVRDALGSAGGEADAASTGGGDGRFRWLFDGAPVGLCLLDLEGVITDCNPAFCRIAGQSRPDLIDRPLKDILASEDVGDLDVLMHRVALGAEDNAHREVRLAHDPDSAAALYIAPMGSGAGVDALVAHFIDTTARRTLEAQFAQAQKMQAMGQLAGGVAHDFNNLLTAMIGFCDLLLQRHGAGDPSFSDIMQIQQNANRAANLVRQLLAFSRKQPLAPRLLDVTDALTEMHHLLRRLLGERVRLDMKHGRDVGMVRVDPGQFDQVIINLAVNARDAMADKGPGREGEDSRLEVRTRSVRVETPFTRGPEHVPAGDYAVITVADTGSGIPRENLGRIFEPFFSTKTGSVGTGTGLGLSTVYGIIRQTGGFIFVDSTMGKGTEFTIYLPRHVGAEAAPTAPRPSAAKPADAADLTGGGRILLVEDEDPVRIFAARALRNKGYTVIEARTAEGALEILNEQPHLDVLITDMVMPGMNGAELARVVRRDRPDLPVILISGYSEEAARGEITDSADMHFLPKPFSLQQLAEKVKDVTTAAPA